MSVRIEGLGRALSRIGRLPGAMREAREEVLNDWADATEASAKELVPIRSGDLKGSIEPKVAASKGIARVGVWNDKTLEYAEYVEKGTSSMREQPYLVPAFEANRASVARTYRAAVRARLGA